MSADKRSVATDALETLGTIIDEHQKRDAIHLAVEPIEAAEDLFPGDDIGIVDGKATASAPEKLGIVDPFLSGMVKKGERFWFIVYPRKITSLRHVWSHPAFQEIDELADLKKAADSKAASETYLRNFACKLFSYYGKYEDDGPEDQLEYLIRGLESGGFFGTDIEYNDDVQPTEELVAHYENYTGKTLDQKPDHFSCSC